MSYDYNQILMYFMTTLWMSPTYSVIVFSSKSFGKFQLIDKLWHSNFSIKNHAKTGNQRKTTLQSLLSGTNSNTIKALNINLEGVFPPETPTIRPMKLIIQWDETDLLLFFLSTEIWWSVARLHSVMSRHFFLYTDFKWSAN